MQALWEWLSVKDHWTIAISCVAIGLSIGVLLFNVAVERRRRRRTSAARRGLLTAESIYALENTFIDRRIPADGSAGSSGNDPAPRS